MSKFGYDAVFFTLKFSQSFYYIWKKRTCVNDESSKENYKLVLFGEYIINKNHLSTYIICCLNILNKNRLFSCMYRQNNTKRKCDNK